MNLKLRICLFTILLFTESSFAQVQSYGKYSITTQPLQFLCRDVAITFERIFKRNTLGVTAAYRFDSDLDRNPLGDVEYWAGRNQAFACPRFNGVTFAINSKYYFTKSSRMYFDAQLFYRFWWYNDRFSYTPYKGSSTGYDYNSSVRNHVVGLKLLWGKSYIPKKTRKINPVFIWYIGVGIRKKIMNEYGEKCKTSFSGNSPYYPFSENSSEWTPTTHAGFNLGVEVFRKNKPVK